MTCPGLSRLRSKPCRRRLRARWSRSPRPDKRVRELTDRALEGEARRLLAEAPPPPPDTSRTVVALYDGWPVADLRSLALHLVRPVPVRGPSREPRATRPHLVFAQADGLGHDVPALLRIALEHVGGRGGGKGNLAQGAGDHLDRLDEALRRTVAVLQRNG